MHVYMASKNINIDIRTYTKLRKVKKEDESFSELLERMLKKTEMALKNSFGTIERDTLDYKEIKKNRRDRDVVL